MYGHNTQDGNSTTVPDAELAENVINTIYFHVMLSELGLYSPRELECC